MQQEIQQQKPEVPKSKRHRKDKPWDNDPTIDKWKMPEIKPQDVTGSFLQQSSFATLFPQYRQKYIQQCQGLIKKRLMQFGVKFQINLIEGSMTVRTTKKTWDPYAIIKARDVIKLLSRSVPYQQALRLMQDGIFCEIVKIRSYVRNKQKFVKRRQRLIGPNGATLKALQLLTQCYILVQGSTVSLIGNFKNIKILRRIIVDTMLNVHPIYHIKELMIKKQLMKDQKLKQQNWDRFLPKFKEIRQKKKKTKQIQKKKEYNPFPPAQLPRKQDLMMQSGQYFLGEKQRKQKALELKKQKQELKMQQKIQKQEQEYEAPAIEEEIKKEQKKPKKQKQVTVDELKQKFLTKPIKKINFF